MVKHCYSVANSSGQSLGTHQCQYCYDSAYNSQACGPDQHTVMSVALGQGVKAGDLSVSVLHLPLTQCDSAHTWVPPFGALPGLCTPESTLYSEPPSFYSCMACSPVLCCFLQGTAVNLERKGLWSQVFLYSNHSGATS